MNRKFAPEIEYFRLGILPVMSIRQGTPTKALIYHHGLDATKETDLRLLLRLVERGFWVIAADGPGFGERATVPRKPSVEVIGRMFFEAARDSAKLREWILNQGFEKISIVGRSLGGMRALIAAAFLDGVVEKLGLIVTGGDFGVLLKQSESATLRDPEFQKRLSDVLIERMSAFDPVKVAMGLRADLPVLLLAGARDEVVPVACARKLAEVLTKQQQHRYIEYPDAAHGLTDQMIDDTVAWMVTVTP